jgi:hypothetical protein
MKFLRFFTKRLNTSVLAKQGEMPENGIHW